MTRSVAGLVAVALALTAAPARAQHANPIARWKAIGHDGGVDAPNWLWDLAYLAASGSSYGALRLVTVPPKWSAATVTVVAMSFHVPYWRHRAPNGDDVYDFTTRAAPAITLALCETKGRKVCVVAIASTIAVNLVSARYSSP